MRTCIYCGNIFLLLRADAKYCSTKCRIYKHRNTLPKFMRDIDRWVRYSPTKTPLTVTGHAASSTNPETWDTYKAVKKSNKGVGMGFVLNGDGISCFDLDHCIIDGKLQQEATEFILSIDYFYSDISPSGQGVHLWHWSEPGPGWRRTIGGLSVEWYSQHRYITVTGQPLLL